MGAIFGWTLWQRLSLSDPRSLCMIRSPIGLRLLGLKLLLVHGVCLRINDINKRRGEMILRWVGVLVRIH
jgi:hypothetical protein